ncbi:hypothetical protein SEPCBS57363_001441 [Sporothrix epigloea]|uniref:Uncharacterized protein n=1 Tax=Sporothrix epigloea TaxID=1892477 RepID=A0ABP0DAC2_9PEZI
MNRPRRDPNLSAAAGTVSAPVSRSGTPTPPVSNYPASDGALQCCCGQIGCIFLQHNSYVLENVENDVRTAAKLGQSLLERHEAYMVDAERDRAELIKRIGKLEMDKRELEAENAKKIRENRALLDQLEVLNTTVADSDAHMKMLEASLQSSQQIIRRLEGAAERAEDMERHLAALEAEQAALQSNLVTSESEARTAIQRWKRAERGLADLQYQLDVMERESREEQERHQEIMDRMERQRAIEKELNTAAGRLKGAAATNLLQESGNGAGSAVVSHFVRDLLQDNANLQLGMAELRDMLMASNDEIQALRDQLVYHQPLFEHNASAASTLRAELDSKLLPQAQKLNDEMQQDVQDVYDSSDGPGSMEASMTLSTLATPQTTRHQSTLSQEFHIHHHYHVSSSGKKMDPKKLKKKRAGITPTLFTPPSAALSTPNTPLYRPSMSYRSDFSAAATPGSSPPSRRGQHSGRDSISTVMSGPSARWSLFSDPPSDLSMSSVPSSPRTDPRNSVFDRAPLCDLSRPVSPTTSVDPMSPMWRTSSRKSSMDDSRQTSSFARSLSFSSPVSLAKQQCQPFFQFPEAIKEDEEVDAHVQCAANPPASNETDDSDTGNSTDDVPDIASSVADTADGSALSEAITPTPSQSPPISSYDPLADAGEVEEISYELLKRHGRPLHRAVSHESIISLQGGLDIHTLKARPSQLTLRPLGMAMADTGLSSITARPFISRAGTDSLKSNSVLRDRLSLGMPATRQSRLTSSTVSGAVSANTPFSATLSATNTLSGARMLGKFVTWRPWGNGNGTNTTMPPTTNSTQSAHTTATAALTMAGQVAPATPATPATPAVAKTSTAIDTTNPVASDVDSSGSQADAELFDQTKQAIAAVQSTTPSAATISVPRSSAKEIIVSGQHPAATKTVNDSSVLRSPGINQPGAIPGFLEYWSAHQRRGAPSNVHADIVDEEALWEGLLGT